MYKQYKIYSDETTRSEDTIRKTRQAEKNAEEKEVEIGDHGETYK